VKKEVNEQVKQETLEVKEEEVNEEVQEDGRDGGHAGLLVGGASAAAEDFIQLPQYHRIAVNLIILVRNL